VKKNKYIYLYEFLKRSKSEIVEMNMKEIEKLIPDLPKSARMRTWWSNNPFNGHSQAHAWCDAGYYVKFSDDKIVFSKEKNL